MVTADQNVVSVSGRLVSLPAPAVRRDNRWFVPVDFIPRALSLALEQRLDLRRAARLLVVGDLRVPRVVARVDAGTTNVAVTFEVTPNTDSRVTSLPGRVVVQFEADALELSIPTLPPQTFLTGITAGDTPATVVLQLGPRYVSHRITTSQADAGSGRVTIDLLPATSDLVGNFVAGRSEYSNPCPGAMAAIVSRPSGPGDPGLQLPRRRIARRGRYEEQLTPHSRKLLAEPSGERT